jgi:alanyl-tRNA synthetase
MGAPYPELRENQQLIERIVHAEEERFNQTLRSGQNYLDAHLDELLASRVGSGDATDTTDAADTADATDTVDATDAADATGATDTAGTTAPTLSGKAAFELHDRYGFPIDLTIEIAAERGIEVDRDGFERHMDDQRERARAAAKDDAWGSGSIFNDILNAHGPTTFVGYGAHKASATVVALVVAAQDQSDPGESRFVLVDRIAAGQRAQVILDRTPFYGEMGGQVGDTGFITTPDGAGDFHVEDTKVYEKAVYAHSGVARGTLAVGDTVTAQIDSLRRERIERNHTATHLLHFALRTILGEHVRQAGSLVAPDRLRFDFTHFEAVTHEQIRRVEELVNNLIMEDSDVNAYETSLDEARASGVTALFGEKYGERVRVLQAGADSRELCGGTHVTHTAQIGFLKVTVETSVGANLRRIEAVTSFDALEYVNRLQAELLSASAIIKAPPAELAERVEALQRRVQELEGELKRQRLDVANDHIDALVTEAEEVRVTQGGKAIEGVGAVGAVGVQAGEGVEEAQSAQGAEPATSAGYRLVVARLDGQAVEGLRGMWDLLRARLGEKSAVVLGSLTPAGTPLLLAAGTPAAVACGFDAGAIIKAVAPRIKGGGGGKPTMAQAGGKAAEGIDFALRDARAMLIG